MSAPELTVWYNTRCPVCDNGIDWQRRKLIELVKERRLAFNDINDEPDALASYGATLDDVRRRLHATDRDGKLIVGADVAVALWRMTRGQRWLAWLLGNPVTLPLTRLAYDRFADALFAWNLRKGHW
jgi:predicted DCC family thiol-disulfide oxidoreductase YuxK